MPPLGGLAVVKNYSNAPRENKILSVVLTVEGKWVVKIGALLKFPDPPLVFYDDPREGEKIHRFLAPLGRRCIGRL